MQHQKYKIDNEIDALFDDLSSEEYKRLKENIKENGILNPLQISPDGIIICGHQRYKAAKELGIPDEKIPCIVIENKSREELMEIAVRENIDRRHLTRFQKAKTALKFLPYYKILAKKRQDNGTLVTDVTKGRSLEHVGKIVGLSHQTMHKVKFIIENGTKKEKEELNHRKKSINRSYDDIKWRLRVENTVKDKNIQKTLIESNSPFNEKLINIANKAPELVKKYLEYEKNRKKRFLSQNKTYFMEAAGMMGMDVVEPASREQLRETVHLDDVLTPEQRELNAIPIEDVEKNFIFSYPHEEYELIKQFLQQYDADLAKALLKLARNSQSAS